MFGGTYFEKTCWVLEGAGFEEPEPMLLEVMEDVVRDAQDRAVVHRDNSKCKESR